MGILPRTGPSIGWGQSVCTADRGPANESLAGIGEARFQAGRQEHRVRSLLMPEVNDQAAESQKSEKRGNIVRKGWQTTEGAEAGASPQCEPGSD